MGENNALSSRRAMVKRETMVAAAAIYDSLFRTEKGVPATFDIMYMIGWAPDPSQRRAAKRGSGQISMKTIAEQVGAQYQSVEEES